MSTKTTKGSFEHRWVVYLLTANFRVVADSWWHGRERKRRRVAGYSAGLRTGVSLVEVLVVLGLITLLIALLVPAVERVREEAARAQCAANLKQLALAVHSYEDVARCFPVDSLPYEWGPYNSSLKCWSWLARILPYIEQDDLYRQGNIPNNTLSQSKDCIATPVSIFFCPSDNARDLGPRPNLANADQTLVAVTNYKGVSGANWKWGDAGWHNPGKNGSWDGLNHGDGIFFRYDWKFPKGFNAVRDGTSNTLMVGEDVPELDQWSAWAHANSAVGTCAIGPNAKNQAGADYSPWDWQNVYGFRSRHTGGLQFACADGSVHFISDTIDLALYRALATIQGDEALAVP